MKKKILAVLLATAMVGTMAGCGSQEAAQTATDAAQTVQETAETVADTAEQAADTVADAADATVDYGTGEIKVWVAEAVVDFTKAQIDTFMAAHPEFSGYTYVVEAVGEGDAAGNMITDVTAGADIFGFPQDQLARLVVAGALETVAPENVDAVKTQNDAGSVAAATVGDELYAYPVTSDNGYFLYYDKSVISDPSTLEGIMEQAEAAGKNVYFEINSGWYNTAFFFGTGCKLDYTIDSTGAFNGSDITYASDAGVVALREMIDLAASPSFQNGSSVSNATNVAAIVDGTWDSSAAKDLFGDNYACAKLPTFTGSDGKTYQLSGFGGFKLLGVKPQDDENKLAVCDALALYLSSEEVQQARYEAVGWGPSNMNVQASAAVKSDEALSALAEQLAFTIPQGQYPGDYWTLATGLGDDVITGVLNKDSSDDDLMAALQAFTDACAAAK